MTNEIGTSVYSRAKILKYLKQKMNQKGGIRKTIIFSTLFVFGIAAIIFATEDTMRDTYGLSLVQVKSMIFLCLTALVAYGVRDYLHFQKTNDK
ncbi:hypothetical protein DL239_09255 [Sedimentitalea sp. CY04]|uniref:Uncharacterized protein n=1 Tax=Parasedimentitalea denitrificans TaxID=2211118 RepID=A0ABX0W687_9RHOB|nr:hypothetical protein [Sedimentitalea sp. CY04]NIZ61163.1 hypothetical protein [Sedimentitalea sp. CY04]